MTNVSWTRGVKVKLTVVEEPANYVMQGRLRWNAVGPDRHIHVLSATAGAVDLFVARLQQNGMYDYIPRLDYPKGENGVM
jgi:hypothetical protein